MSLLLRDKLVKKLPILNENSCIRYWRRSDLDLLAKWPSYPFPYQSLNYRFNGMSESEKDRHYDERESNPDRITLILDRKGNSVIGYLALVEIDWKLRRVGNMAVRIEPNWCDSGIGTGLLKDVSGWGFEQGIVSFNLNVVASNQRAIRCYQKAGYHIVSEFWQDDEGLKGMDLDKSEFDFLRPHARTIGNMTQLRFYWMESKV